MPGLSEKSRDLCSWKEIAEFLAVSVRTAQIWERERGLPVHRLPGSRGRVFALPVELVAWKTSAAGATALRPEPAPEPGAQTRARVRGRAAYLGVAAFAVVASVAFWAQPHRGRPGLFRLDQRVLIVSDDQGRELWRRDLNRPVTAAGSGRRAWFGDLDGDGRTEVLLRLRGPDANHPDDALFCFAEDGALRWQFRPGKPVATSNEEFRPPFLIHEFEAAPLGKSGRMGVALSSGHHSYYPSIVTLLDAGGRVLHEYWHSGRLGSLAIADLDGDRRNEIYAAGTNNASNQGTLIVLDPDNFGGASTENASGYQLKGFEPERVRARILFPRTCVNTKLEVRNSVARLWFDGGHLTVHVLERLEQGHATIYTFDRELRLERADITDGFKAEHKQLHLLGRLDHAFSGDELRHLAQGVRVLRDLQARASR